MADPFQLLLSLCQQWEELTDLQAQALEAGDWKEMQVHQRAKSALQIHMESFSGQVPQPQENQLREIGSRLIAAEQQNARRLSARLASLQGARTESESISRTLAKIQRHYGSRPQAHWHSFS